MAEGEQNVAARPDSSSVAGIRIAILGSLTVTLAADGSRHAVSGRTQQRLVAALAVASCHDILPTIDELVDAVYGDEPAPSADATGSPRRSIATQIWRLRRAWGADAIGSDRYHYWLDPQLVAIDAREFADAAQQGRAAAAAGAAEQATALFRSAIDLWQGEVSGAVPAAERDRLTDLRFGVTERLADLLADGEHHAEVISLLTELVRTKPSWEHSQALLVRSHLAVGDRSGAARAFDIARRHLAEVGVDPGPELAAAGGAAIDPVATAATVGRNDGRAGSAGAPGTAAAAEDRTTTAAGNGRTPPGARTARHTDPAYAAGESGIAASDSFFGRQRERAALVGSILLALDSRRPASIVVSGEAGIGKTTLVRAASIDVLADRDVRVVTLQCDQRSTLPYGPLAGIADAGADANSGVEGLKLPALLAVSPGASPVENAAQLHSALLHDVVALTKHRGLILIVEDLQWAPIATSDALAAVLQRCGAVPLAVVTTSRNPENSHPIAALADRHIPLTGLSTDEVARLAGLPVGSPVTAQLHQLTGGNPLFVRQLPRPGASSGIARDRSGFRFAEPPGDPPSQLPHELSTEFPSEPPAALPPDLSSAIDAHIGQVPGRTQAVLRIAAAIGDAFDVITLSALAGPLHRSPAEWQEQLDIAIRYGLVRPDGGPGRFRFVHTLVAGQLYQQLTPTDRVETHAAITRALDRIGLARPTAADLVAHHATRGWPTLPTAQVVGALITAARAVGAQLDFVQSADYYRSALDYLAMDPAAATESEIISLLGVAAAARAAAGDLAAAGELYESQERLAAAQGLARPRVVAALGALRLHFAKRSHPRVASALADAVAEFMTNTIDDVLTGEDLALVGDALAAISVFQPGRAQELLTAAQPHGLGVTVPLRLAVWEHQAVPDQLRVARELAAELPPGAPPDTQVAVWLRWWVSEIAAGIRRFDDPPPCDATLAQADDQTAFDLAQWRITCDIAAGRLAAAHAHIDAALQGPVHADPTERARRAASFYGQRLYATLLAGGPLSPAQSPILSNPTWVSKHPLMRYIRVYIAARSGVEQASALCDDLVSEISDGDIPDSDIVPRLILLTEACRQVDNREGLDRCRSALQLHRGEHGIFRFGQYWGVAEQSIGDAHLALGELDAAIADYRAAIAQLEAVGAPVHIPTVRRSLAIALQQRGRRTDAAEVASLRLAADAMDRAMNLDRTPREAPSPGGRESQRTI